ncbi:MAG: cation:proton antiporter [Gammaproteobacteria bacterium]|nr:cation:proton antiporter [Gammaproteobacteria bacterium]
MPLSETVLIIMALLATGIVASGVFRKLPIPYTVILIVIGIALARLSEVWHPLEPLQHFHLTPDLVLFIFLPALIFESGLNLNSRQLIKDMAPVLTLAVPALLISTGLVGVGLWLFLPSIDLMVALLFGALISATDPVAVISLFKELGTPERLTVMVEGESLLNDATAIVVVTILLGLYAASPDSGWEVAGTAVSQFLFVFFGGALVGAVFGLVISWMMTRFAHESSSVLILSLVLAYVSFVVAEHELHVSGVMAVVACAIVFGIFGMPRLSRESVELMHETWEFIAHICNTLLFLFVGMLVDFGSLVGDIWYILLAVILVQASRAALVYSSVPLVEKVFKLPHVTLGERHIMFWGGLKGGLAIAIVLSLPVDLPGRELLIHLTLGVVLFTMLVNAPTIRPLIRKLGIDKLSADELAELKRSIIGARGEVDSILDRFRKSGLLSKAGHHMVKDETNGILNQWLPEVIGDDEYRHNRLNALNAEAQEMDDLFKAGVLNQYSYLDLRNEIMRKRDHIVTEHRVSERRASVRQNNIFVRFEDALVKWLREKDWAVCFLSHYQNRRLSSHLMRDISRILMAEAALKNVHADPSISAEHRQKIESNYSQLLDYFREHISDTRNSFPEFFERFETSLCAKSALVAALHDIEEAYHRGSLTTKVYVYLEERIHYAIDEIRPITEPVQELPARDLITLIPLFSGLPEVALDKIAQRATTVNYLEGDTIIGTGDHGDALYVIARGRLEALLKHGDEETRLGELGAGDFFGEMALLGDSVRKADVRAISSCSLLRINSKDVMEVAHQHPEISGRLEKAKAERSI